MKITQLPAALAALTLASAAAMAQPSISGQYRFITLDFPGSLVSYPLGINSQRVVSGFYVDINGIEHGYTWKNGKFTEIDYPGAPLVPGGGSGAGDINDRGDVVGIWIDANGFQHGYVRRMPDACDEEDNGRCKPVFESLDVPGAAQTQGIEFELGTGLGTNAIGINNQGDISGLYATEGLYSNGFIFAHGVFRHYDNPKAGHGPGLGTKLFGINDNGAAAGDYMTQDNPQAPQFTHGFLLEDGRYTAIEVPGSTAGGFGTQVNGINNAKTLVGLFSTPDGASHAMVWKDGKFFTVDFPGMPNNEAHTINNNGDITGAYTTDPDGNDIHGFVAFPKQDH